MFLVPNPRILCVCVGGALKKKNAEVELLEILCSHSDVDERTPPPQPQQIALQSHADMAGNHKLGREGDLGQGGVQVGGP